MRNSPFPKTEIGVFTLLILIGFLIYSNTFHSPFQYDDKIGIQKNFAVKDLTDIPAIWRSFNSRFVVGLSFALNFWLGGLQVVGYRLTNISIHILSSICVYKFVILILRSPALQNNTSGDLRAVMAFFISLIFLVHPIQTEAVNLLMQRAALLASLFYLMTLCFYAKARETSSSWYRMASILTTILAMFCKEFAITLPLMILFYEICFWGFQKTDVRKKIWVVLPYFLTLPIIPLTLLQTTPSTAMPARITALTSSPDTSTSLQVDITRALGAVLPRKEYFLTELNVLVTYVRLLFFPVNQNVDYDYPISHSLGEPNTFVSFIVLGFILFFAGRLLHKYRFISFGIFLFFLVLSIESSIIPIGHVIAEYRLYLAMLGVTMSVVAGLFVLLKNPKEVTAFVICVALIFSVASHRRNSVFKDEITLWQDVVKKSPNKLRPYINLGYLYTDAGRFEDASVCYQKVLELNPHNSSAYVNLGVIKLKQSQLSEAREFLYRARLLDPAVPEIYANLGFIEDYLKNYDLAVEHYQKAIALSPFFEEAHFALGLVYVKKNDRENANRQVSKLRELRRFDLAGELEGAIRDQHKILR